ncbi:MAG: hypothetical protein ACE5KW_00555, partial [Dehalococcoidia bacterium]
SLDGAALTVDSWSDTSLDVTIPAGQPDGPQQLLVRASNEQISPSGLTFHVLGAGYSPTVATVAGPTPGAIQDAINAASGDTLIVVEPGIYYENLLLHGKGAVPAAPTPADVKLQGVGPGGVYPDGTPVPGSVIDGRFFEANDVDRALLLEDLGVDVELPVGSTIATVADPSDFEADFNFQVDGFTITGGRSLGRGGGVLVDRNGSYMEISNNLIQSNGASFGGAIVVGAPYRGENANDSVHIHHNRIANNGGFSLAGAVGIFTGADSYEIDHNEFCGNYSSEYGGGISHFGLSPGGHIHHNRMYFNYAFDEGGALLVGGELPRVEGPEIEREFGGPPPPPAPPDATSAGSGAVDIDHNLIQSNLSNDDGGGIMLLNPGEFPVTITNNIVVNNVSADFGAIVLDDGSDVTIVNNTIAKNISTATAEDADAAGVAHGAGLVSTKFSTPFADSLGLTCPPAGLDTCFLDPVLFNNIFWENEAYTWDGTALVFDSVIDLEVFGTLAPEIMTPEYSSCTAVCPGPGVGNIAGDPLFLSEFDTAVDVQPYRLDPLFITVLLVVVDLPPELVGDYHLDPTSPAIDVGAASGSTAAPDDDYDGDPRPIDGDDSGTAEWDMGADEVPETASAAITAAAGGSVTTGADATAVDSVETTVDVPAGAASQDATLSIVETTAGELPSGFAFLGQQVNIGVTAGTTFSAPVTIEFEIDSSLLPIDPFTVEVFKNGALVLDCITPSTPDPDPCVDSKVLDLDGDLVITIKTTSFSGWGLGAEAGSLGDVNCDGAVGMADALLIARYTIGHIQSLPCPQNANVNVGGAVTTSGDITMVDALFVARYVVGLVNQLPPK